jgi:hypothetical protein
MLKVKEREIRLKKIETRTADHAYTWTRAPQALASPTVRIQTTTSALRDVVGKFLNSRGPAEEVTLLGENPTPTPASFLLQHRARQRPHGRQPSLRRSGAGSITWDSEGQVIFHAMRKGNSYAPRSRRLKKGVRYLSKGVSHQDPTGLGSLLLPYL